VLLVALDAFGLQCIGFHVIFVTFARAIVSRSVREAGLQRKLGVWAGACRMNRE